MSVIVGVLTGISTLLTGRIWGAAGVVVGYFLWGGVFYVTGGTFIFFRLLRRRWHAEWSNPYRHIRSWYNRAIQKNQER